ncbi:hypothetical protein EDC01DRAFT_630740 [Geopyxis carbonaria]|nr:hypothetical protein EDC01DRAFT_630740 [Geopyxis carbonaria]
MPRDTRQNAKLRLGASLEPEVQQAQHLSSVLDSSEVQQAHHLGTTVATLEAQQAHHLGTTVATLEAQQAHHLGTTVATPEAQQAQHRLCASSDDQQAKHLGSSATSEAQQAQATQNSKRSRFRNTRQNAKFRLGVSSEVKQAEHLGTVATLKAHQAPQLGAVPTTEAQKVLAVRTSRRARLSYKAPVQQRKAPKSSSLKVPKKTIPAQGTKRPRLSPPEQLCRQVPKLNPAQQTSVDPVAKKRKEEIELDFSYLLQFTVNCGPDHKVVNEGGVHDAHPDRRTFNFTAALEREKTAVMSHERSSKKTFTKCEPMEGGIQATVVLEGKGQISTARTVREATDWIEVEKIIHYYITSKRKISQVTLHAKYEETVEVQGNETDEDSPNTEDDQPKVQVLPLSASSAVAASSTPQIPGIPSIPNVPRKRKTVTEQERAKALAAQATGENHVIALHQRWRCQNPRCSNNGFGSCLVLPGEQGQCRKLNAQQLGPWNEAIIKGKATIEDYPISILKLPPLDVERTGKNKHFQQQNSPYGPASIIVQTPSYYPPPYGSFPQTHPPTPSAAACASSPINCSPSEDPDMLLQIFLLWYAENRTANQKRRDAVMDASRKLEAAFEDLQGVHKMTDEGWERLGVPSGIGKALSREAKKWATQRKAVQEEVGRI